MQIPALMEKNMTETPSYNNSAQLCAMSQRKHDHTTPTSPTESVIV